MFQFEILFLMQCLLGFVMMIFLHKINKIKKQIDTITKEVKDYLAFVEEDIEQQPFVIEREKNIKTSKDVEENRIIQAVLKEYFP